MKSTINKIIDIEAALVQKSTGLLTKIHELSYTEEDPINKKLSDILALFESTQGGSTGNDSNSGESDSNKETFDYTFSVYGTSSKEFEGNYKPTDDTKNNTGINVIYTAGDNKYCYCDPALGYWRFSYDGKIGSDYRTKSYNLENPWDAGRDGWYNEGGGFDYSSIYIHMPTSQHGYLIVPIGSTLNPVSPVMYGLYTESNETSDGIPVYINEMGYKLYRITFNDYGTYWCISNTVTTPDNIYTQSYAESTANTPPSTMGGYAILNQ